MQITIKLQIKSSLKTGASDFSEQSVQEERTIRDRTLLEVRDSDHRIPWKVRFNLGNSSRQMTQCRNSIQGKTLLTDELGESQLATELRHDGLVFLPSNRRVFPSPSLFRRLRLREERLAGQRLL